MDYRKWPLAVKIAEYVLNRSPCRGNGDSLTPYKLYFERRPNVSNFCVFSCVAWQHINKEVRKPGTAKFDERAIERVFVGYTSNGYVLMDTKLSKTFHLCNVDFIKGKRGFIK